MCNFYSLYFEENQYIPLIRKGVRIELKNNIAYLDGICSYRVTVQPQICESTSNLDKLFFLYANNTPWIAKENDGNFYLYKGSIDEVSLNLKFDINEDYCYIAIELCKTGNVNIDEGRIFTRLFKNDKQICILKVKKYANIVINQENLVTILEWNGEEFICK